MWYLHSVSVRPPPARRVIRRQRQGRSSYISPLAGGLRPCEAQTLGPPHPTFLRFAIPGYASYDAVGDAKAIPHLMQQLQQTVFAGREMKTRRTVAEGPSVVGVLSSLV